jgi:hypothetical protein
LINEWRLGDTKSAIFYSHDFIDERVLPFLLALGFVATVARLGDYFFLRGIPLVFDPNQVRGLLEKSSANFASAIYALLNPAVYAAALLGLARISQGSYSRAALASVALLCCAPLTSLLVGGRSVIFLIFALILVTLIFSLRNISYKFIAGCALSILIVFLVTMTLFLQRTRFEDTGLHLDQLIQQHGFAEHVPADDRIVIFIRDARPLLSSLTYYATTVGQYILHGFFEFFVVLQQKDPSDPLLWGRTQFDLVNRIWMFLASRTELPILGVEAANPRSGIFTTFWGPAYIDFGLLMIPYAFLLGAVIDYFRVQVQRGDFLALPLYSLFIVQVAISPWVNGFATAAASYLNIGLFLLWLVGRACYSLKLEYSRLEAASAHD